MSKVYIKTFGCQANQRDSELTQGMLAEKGFEAAERLEDADIILFNTCSVRQHAEDRVMGNLQKMAGRKKKNPGLRIGIIGCMAQRHGDLLFKEYPHLDIVIGPNNLYDISDLLARLSGEDKILAVNNKKRPVKKEDSAYRANLVSAFVNIMYGCENFCSYCIVPYVRGKEVSRPKKDIINEVKVLADKGVKEITLLGQNVNSYGKGLSNKVTFPELLAEINGIKGIERIRFITSHPKDADKSLFRAINELDKVCKELHLPLQSGSNKILDLMNRKYTCEDYKRKVDLLRAMVPEAGLTTDIIVGFPSEKERDFDATRKALEEIEFNSAFIFKYSPRPPALSSYLVDDVPEEVKKERNNLLLSVQKEISHKKNKAAIGSIQEALACGKSRMDEKELSGKTPSGVSCVFPGEENLVGKLVKVNIIGASPFTLKGKIIADNGG